MKRSTLGSLLAIASIGAVGVHPVAAEELVRLEREDNRRRISELTDRPPRRPPSTKRLRNRKKRGWR